MWLMMRSFGSRRRPYTRWRTSRSPRSCRGQAKGHAHADNGRAWRVDWWERRAYDDGAEVVAARANRASHGKRGLTPGLRPSPSRSAASPVAYARSLPSK